MALTEVLQKLALKIPTPLVAGGAKLLFGLPVPVKQRLGSPRTVEGNELDVDSQLTLLLLGLQGSTACPAPATWPSRARPCSS